MKHAVKETGGLVKKLRLKEKIKMSKKEMEISMMEKIEKAVEEGSKNVIIAMIESLEILFYIRKS